MSFDAPTLVGIDPAGCGCTECAIDQATDEDIQALFDGVLRDNTDDYWLIAERTMSFQSDGFDIFANGHTFTIKTLALPVAVDNFNIHLSKESFEEILSGGGYPTTLGKDY